MNDQDATVAFVYMIDLMLLVQFLQDTDGQFMA